MQKMIKSKKYVGVYYYELEGKDKAFYVTYKNADNKKVWEKIGKYSEGIREDFCNQKRVEKINSLKFGDDTPIVKNKRVNGKTFEELANHYLKSLQHPKTTVEYNGCFKNVILPIIGDKQADLITKEDVLKVLDKVSHLSDKSQNKYLFLIKTVFNHATKEGIYTKPIPVLNIKPKKLDNTRERYLSKDEVKELLEAVKDTQDLLIFTKLSLITGGRFETVMNIKKLDINLSDKSVTLKDFKNNSTYKGRLDSDTIELISPILATLSPNDKLIRWNGNTIAKKMRAVLNKLFNQGIAQSDRKNRAVIHTLRHTFASHLAINGVPIYTIKALMNHSDISQTMRYAKLSPESGSKEIEELWK